MLTQQSTMSIQTELTTLEQEIEILKTNKLPIEDQIKLYSAALKINQTKKTIDALKHDISIIEADHDINQSVN